MTIEDGRGQITVTHTGAIAPAGAIVWYCSPAGSTGVAQVQRGTLPGRCAPSSCRG